MQHAIITYILKCNACGVRGEIEEYTETFICPECHAEMKLSEVRISGDDSSIEVFLKKMIDSAEHGDIVAKRSIAFLADSPNEHTRSAVENAWYRRKYPEFKNIQKHNKANVIFPAQQPSTSAENNTRQPTSQQTRKISGLTQNRKTINAAQLPSRTNHIRFYHSKKTTNGQKRLNAENLPAHHTIINTTITNNNKEKNMKNAIPVELDSDYEISGSITAFPRERSNGRCIAVLADIHCKDWVFIRPHVEYLLMAKISVYDEDGDICTSEAILLRDFWKNGAEVTIPDGITPAKVVVLIGKGYFDA